MKWMKRKKNWEQIFIKHKLSNALQPSLLLFLVLLLFLLKFLVLQIFRLWLFVCPLFLRLISRLSSGFLRVKLLSFRTLSRKILVGSFAQISPMKAFEIWSLCPTVIWEQLIRHHSFRSEMCVLFFRPSLKCEAVFLKNSPVSSKVVIIEVPSYSSMY